MRRFVLILGFLLTLSNCSYSQSSSEKQQEFVNPIFNKTLYSYSKQTWNTQLSPSSIIASPDNLSDPNAYIEQYPCELLENKHDHVKFNCTICYGYLSKLEAKDCYHDIIIYQITTDGKIKETTFNPKHPEFQSIEYLITKTP